MKTLLCCAALLCITLFFPTSVFALTSYPATISDISLSHTAVCGSSAKGHVRCHARVLTEPNGLPHVTNVPSGYGPAQFRGAYSVDGVSQSKNTIAIVDAYDDPTILQDVNVYSDTFGLPKLASCPVSAGTPNNPCLEKINQKGGTNLPNKNSGWAMEIALDVEVAHALCENCNILLVEASSSSMTSLLAAFDTAVKKGAKIISNSWGGQETTSERSYDKHFNLPGRFIAFSSGDNGYGVSYPAASEYVTAVGGTTLHLVGNTSYKSEVVWAGTGSGCSAYESKPAWQHDEGCSKRSVADIAADADPHTGAAIYSSTVAGSKKGWLVIGGTSLAAPLVAGIVAQGDKMPAHTLVNALFYGRGIALTDITVGSNGSCARSYLCHANDGYDGPTGLGTPKGPSIF